MVISFGVLGCFLVFCSTIAPLINGETLLWTQHSHGISRLRGLQASRISDWNRRDQRENLRGQFTQQSHYKTMVYDHVRQLIYWYDSDDQTKKVYKQRYRDAFADYVEATESDVVFSCEYRNHLTSLAVDWITGNLYYTEVHRTAARPRTGIVGVISTKPGQRNIARVLVSLEEHQTPTAITLDPVEGKMYFAVNASNDESESMIYSADMTGLSSMRDAERVVRAGEYRGYASSLYLDKSDNPPRLYYADIYRDNPKYKSICAVEVGDRSRGERWEVVVQDQELGTGHHELLVYEDYIIASASNSFHIRFYGKEDYNDIERFSINVDAEVLGLDMVRPQETSDTECDALACGDICMNLGNNRGQCSCRQGYYLLADDRSCTDSEPRYIYSQGSTLWDSSVTIAQVGNTITVNRREESLNRDISHVLALGFHYERGFVYLDDVDRDVLYRTRPDSEDEEHMLEVTVNTRNVEGIVVDWTSDLVFWSDADEGHIMCSELDGRFHHVLISNLTSPRGVAVDPQNGYIFWVSGGDSAIYRAQLDGTLPSRLVEDDTELPQGITVDVRKKRIYWSDRRKNTIESVYINGTGRIVTQMISGSNIYDATIYEDFTTWTNDRKELKFGEQTRDGGLELDDITAGSMASGFTDGDMYDVIAYNDYLQPIITGSCAGHHCEQLCFATSQGPSCGCAIGFTLNTDGISCDTSKDSGTSILFTDPYHKQIYHITRNPPDIMETPRSRGIKLPPSEHPVSVAVNYVDDTMIWLDLHVMQIHSSYWDGSDKKIIYRFDQDLNPGHLIVLQTSPAQVCFTELSAGSIQCLTLDAATKLTTVVTRLEGHLSGLAAATDDVSSTDNGVLYYVTSRNNTEVIRHDVLANQRHVMYRNNEGSKPTSIAVSPDGMNLYWNNMNGGEIFHLPINISNPQIKGEVSVIYSEPSYKISALTADNSTIYFSAWNEKTIFSLVPDGNGSVPIDVPVYARITDLKLINTDLIIVPVSYTEGDTGYTLYIIIGGAAFLLLLLILVPLILLFALKRKKKMKNKAPHARSQDPPMVLAAHGDRPFSGIIDVDTDIFQPTDGHAFQDSPRDMASGFDNEGFADIQTAPPPPPMPPPIVPDPALLRPGKYRKNPKREPSTPKPNEFEITGDAKVATVIQRLTNRLRNRLSSIRFNDGSNQRPAIDTEAHEVSPEGATDNTINNAQHAARRDKTKVDVQPQLHRLPRGFAPASRVVPNTVQKTTWGKSAHRFIKPRPTS